MKYAKVSSASEQGVCLRRKIPSAKWFLIQSMIRPKDEVCKFRSPAGLECMQMSECKASIQGGQHHEDVLGPKVTIDLRVVAQGVDQLEGSSTAGPWLESPQLSPMRGSFNPRCGK